jgi:pimeloyl-ACP methyl ester carboxylesterase
LISDVEALRAVRLNNLAELDLTVDAVAGIRTPTLIYSGSEDKPEPKRQAEVLMPCASFVMISSLDHALAFNRAELVLPIVLAFLAAPSAPHRSAE